MAISPSSPVTGAAITGLTTPTYTLSSDMAPTSLGKQWAVTGLGGTQTGVSVNSPTFPFTFTFVRPATLKSVAPIKTGSNQLTANNRNVWKAVFRKGAFLNASGTVGVMISHVDWDVPAGMEAYSPAEVKAVLSLQCGLLWAMAQGLADTLLTGVV